MSNLYNNVVSEVGQYWLAAVHLFNKADQEIDTDVPAVSKLLQAGEVSVANIFPAIGPKAAEVLNAGVELLGSFQSAVDGTVAIEPTVQAQFTALAPSGYSAVLIKTDVLSDVQALLAKYKAELATAKSAVVTAKAAV